MLVFILSVLALAAGMDPKQLLRKGAIVSPQHSVLVVRDVVSTEVPLGTLNGIPDRLHSLRRSLS